MLDINTITDVKLLGAFLKSPQFVDQHKEIEARIAVLKPKPGFKYNLKVSPKGGVIPPMAVYLDADGGTTSIQSLIDALEAAKTDPRVKPYSKG
jgi:hypothetical protein